MGTEGITFYMDQYNPIHIIFDMLQYFAGCSAWNFCFPLMLLKATNIETWGWGISLKSKLPPGRYITLDYAREKSFAHMEYRSGFTVANMMPL